MERPIADTDFLFAANILSVKGSKTLTQGEFILLELMRLGRINASQINAMKKRFRSLDKQNRRELDFDELKQSGHVFEKNPSVYELLRRYSDVLFSEVVSPKKSHTQFHNNDNIEDVIPSHQGNIGEMHSPNFNSSFNFKSCDVGKNINECNFDDSGQREYDGHSANAWSEDDRDTSEMEKIIVMRKK